MQRPEVVAGETIVENHFTGERLVLRRVIPGTESDYIEIEGSLPPGGEGPPAHAHPLQEEEGVVLSGMLGARINGEVHTFGVGERVRFAPGAVHTWWNAGTDELRFRGRITPALNFDRLLQHFFAAINRGVAGRPSMFDAAFLLRAYRREYRFALLPHWVQVVAFPAVVTLGTLLGKYRNIEPAELWNEPPTSGARAERWALSKALDRPTSG